MERRARVKAFAKINLELRVLHKRPDGYHELRTVYQTISLADDLEISFRKARRSRVEVACDVDIADNLAGRAAELALEAMRVRGEVGIRLQKRIPMGAGLGGGSSDAAAVLLALPVLAGRPLRLEELLALAGRLGSDVPFFLLGGTALGVGRGEEVYPLPDAGRAKGLLVAPDVHVSTAEAYRALGRELTTAPQGNIISSFQSCVWDQWAGAPASGKTPGGINDFETVVFARHPRLRRLRQELARLGAERALMSGSGSALYGIFRTRKQIEAARASLGRERLIPFAFVSRAAYRSVWRRCLREWIGEEGWPPRSQKVSRATTS
jgi:4-diphosphocytidyl-2-C-methyl-D-erythritol kinase